jgi:hypothetical protein
MKVCVSANLRICVSVRKAGSVAVRAPTQPHPKDFCSNEVFAHGVIITPNPLEFLNF